MHEKTPLNPPRLSILASLLHASALCLPVVSAHAQASPSLVQEMSGTANTWQHFTVEVPPGTTTLTVAFAGGRGDGDLYVRAAERPTASTFDCRPYLGGNDETCAMPDPVAGTWHIAVNGYTDFSEATLRVSWAMQCVTTAEGAATNVTATTATTTPTTEGANNAGTTAPPGSQNGQATTPTTNPAGAAWLERHNAHRANHCAPPLAWDENLVASAQAWADRCVFEHEQGTGVGENLFAAVGNASPAAAVDGWYNEVTAYDFSAPGFSAETGHFTQVVWRNTTAVGCAVAVCPGLFPGFGDASFYVCRYAPAGNNTGAGQFEQNVIASGTACQ